MKESPKVVLLLTHSGDFFTIDRKDLVDLCPPYRTIPSNEEPDLAEIFLKCLTFARLVLMMFYVTQIKANYLHNPDSESHAQQSF